MPTRPWTPCPPIFMSSTEVVVELVSSSAYLVRMTNLSLVNFWGQWQCSQVSRAGRRS